MGAESINGTHVLERRPAALVAQEREQDAVLLRRQVAKAGVPFAHEVECQDPRSQVVGRSPRGLPCEARDTAREKVRVGDEAHQKFFAVDGLLQRRLQPRQPRLHIVRRRRHGLRARMRTTWSSNVRANTRNEDTRD